MLDGHSLLKYSVMLLGIETRDEINQILLKGSSFMGKAQKANINHLRSV